jgi:hypothetical protein
MLTIDDITMVDRAEALFASGLPTGTTAAKAELNTAVTEAWLSNGGPAGCTAALATAYGENPGAAAERMRWALRALRRAYPTTATPTVNGREAA